MMQDDDISSDAGRTLEIDVNSDVGRKSGGSRTDVRRKLNGSRTEVGRTSDGNWTDVDDAISDVSQTQDSLPKIGRKFDENP
jgi:hypothetical protein